MPDTRPQTPVIVSSADILIGPNGSLWDGTGPQTLRMSRDGEERINIATLRRDGATPEALRTEISSYPERVTGRFSNILDNIGRFGIDWSATDSLEDGLETHRSIIEAFTKNYWGLNNNDAQRVERQYVEAIRRAALGSDDEVAGVRDSRAGMRVLEEFARSQTEPLLNDEFLGRVVSSEPPIYRSIFTIDLNGQVHESEDGARLHVEQDLRTPVPAANVLHTLDDLRFFSTRTAEETVEGYRAQLAEARDIEAARTVNAQMTERLADRLSLRGPVRDNFLAESTRSAQAASLAELRDPTDALSRFTGQIDRQVATLEASPSLIADQVTARSGEHYRGIIRDQNFLEGELRTVSDQLGVSNFMRGLRFELSRGSFSFGGGTTGAEAHVDRSAVVVSDTMMRLVESGTMTLDIFRRNLTEEVMHSIDLRSGLSEEPRWRAFADRVVNTPELRTAWADFTRTKAKSGPEYYQEYGGVGTELLVDLADMHRQVAAIDGPATARAHIENLFGSEGAAFLDEFHATIGRTEAAAARLFSPEPARTSTPAAAPAGPELRIPGLPEVSVPATGIALATGLLAGEAGRPAPRFNLGELDAGAGRGVGVMLGGYMLLQQLGPNGTLARDTYVGGAQGGMARGSTATIMGAVAVDSTAILSHVAQAAGSTSRVATMLETGSRVGGRVFIPLAIAGAVLQTGAAIEGQDGRAAVEAGVGGGVGLLAGLTAGAAAGAVIGTFIPVPVVGTVVGAVVGGVVGLGAAAVSGWAASHVAGDEAQRALDQRASDACTRLRAELAILVHKREQGQTLSAEELNRLDGIASNLQQDLRRDYTRALPASDTDAIARRDASIRDERTMLGVASTLRGRPYEEPAAPEHLVTHDDSRDQRLWNTVTSAAMNAPIMPMLPLVSVNTLIHAPQNIAHAVHEAQHLAHQAHVAIDHTVHRVEAAATSTIHNAEAVVASGLSTAQHAVHEVLKHIPSVSSALSTVSSWMPWGHHEAPSAPRVSAPPAPRIAGR